MSNPPGSPPPPRSSHDHHHALEALQNLHQADHEPDADDHTAEPSLDESHAGDISPGSGSATGVVASLAQPVPAKRPATEPLPTAREVTAAPASSRPGPRVPSWYHVAAPMMFTLSALLLLIAGWAIGAVIYIGTQHPVIASDVHYPLLSFDPAVGDEGGISAGSRLMAWIMMIACLPISLALAFFAIIMQRQILRAKRYAAAQAAPPAEVPPPT